LITTKLKLVRRLFIHPDVPESTARHNMRAWVRSIRQLGNSWLLCNPCNPLQPLQPPLQPLQPPLQPLQPRQS